jgi:hypothetical protein
MSSIMLRNWDLKVKQELTQFNAASKWQNQY